MALQFVAILVVLLSANFAGAFVNHNELSWLSFPLPSSLVTSFPAFFPSLNSSQDLSTPVCSNTCIYASDGVCDDFRGTNKCPPATDCADCGALGSPPPKPHSNAINSKSNAHFNSNSLSFTRDSLGIRLLRAAYRRLTVSDEEEAFLEQQLVNHDGRNIYSNGHKSSSQHKDLFPLDWSDIFGIVLVTLGLLVAASGGIGGGGILVPLLILVFGFSPKHAIPLSNFTILGSSVTNMVLNLDKRHPSEDRPLVDWDLILVMEPLTMAGAIVGAFVSKILPDWILVLSLVALLAYTTHGTVKKGLQQWNKESEQHADEAKSLLSQVL
jgi:hypothetical protein